MLPAKEFVEVLELYGEACRYAAKLKAMGQDTVNAEAEVARLFALLENNIYHYAG